MNNSSQVAGQLGLGSLYHYQNFNLEGEEDHVERLADILKNHRIWCSNPATFNDPWDCKPYFDPGFLNDPQARAATAEVLISTRKGGTELNRIDDQLRTDPEFLKNTMRQFSAELVTFIASRWGVYCLSADPCHTLMWSHYAREHKGICLEFAVAGTKFSLARQVRYQKEYPALLLHDPDSTDQMLRVKSDDWIYEREFRLICPRFTDVRHHPLLMDGNYLQIGPNDLLSIILGCQIDNDTKAQIKMLVTRHAPDVRVREAPRSKQVWPCNSRLKAIREGTEGFPRGCRDALSYRHGASHKAETGTAASNGPTFPG
jgi:hypothetical protein